ncbi:hypothetical protein BH09BAC6_BH09BAC6_09020 [soil metagenome]|jgi:hypothetical protein
MITSNKCLIDNWSIQEAITLLENDKEAFGEPNDLFLRLGSFSNLINAILFYETPQYLENGNEIVWNKFDSQKYKILSYLEPAKPIDANYYSANYCYLSEDFGAGYYLMMANILNSELFVNPYRSSKITQCLPIPENSFNELLNIIDKKIDQETDNIWLSKVKCGIKNNFLLPSLTHYVLKLASTKDDLLDVVFQLKNSKEIQVLKTKIEEVSLNAKSYTIFQNEVEALLKKQFNKEHKGDMALSMDIKLLFFTLKKSIDFDFFQHKRHLVYLKDIIDCRTETFGLRKELERIFKIRIDI